MIIVCESKANLANYTGSDQRNCFWNKIWFCRGQRKEDVGSKSVLTASYPSPLWWHWGGCQAVHPSPAGPFELSYAPLLPNPAPWNPGQLSQLLSLKWGKTSIKVRTQCELCRHPFLFICLLVDVCGRARRFLLMCSALSAFVIFVETKPSSPASNCKDKHRTVIIL